LCVAYNGGMRGALVLLVLWSGCDGCAPLDRRVHVSVGADRVAATVSDRYLSVAVDTAQVVGGNFWTPGQTADGGSGPVPAFDFGRARLNALAQPLAHAYLRIGGTDADRTYYALEPSPPPSPPPNYAWLLTRAELDALGAFARALDWQILFTLNAGSGPRVNNGPWQPDNARALMQYAAQTNLPIAVWELGNEVNAYVVVLGFPLSPADYATDVAAARTLIAAESPSAKLAAPASAYWPVVGEIGGLLPAFVEIGGSSIDVLTWHYYPQESARCPVAVWPAKPTWLLDPQNLDEIDRWADQVEAARAGSAPQAVTWLDETSNAQCGGAPGISDTFVSSLWWLDELGKMARRGTPVLVRQSLTGADYGLLSEPSLDPRPDYFASLLWRRLMGARVLDAAVEMRPNLRVYAHCAPPDAPAGAVTVLAINLDEEQSQDLAFDGVGGARSLYLATGDTLQSPTVRLNGTVLAAAQDGTPPPLTPSPAPGDAVILPPTSYAFIEFPKANAKACR
jgi:heparanase